MELVENTKARKTVSTFIKYHKHHNRVEKPASEGTAGNFTYVSATTQVKTQLDSLKVCTVADTHRDTHTQTHKAEAHKSRPLSRL